jgi:hypothetical protein
MNKFMTLVSIIAALTLAACEQSEPTGTAGVATNVAADCPIADDSGSIRIAPGLAARVVKSGYGRAAVNGDYADTNVWLWQFDETAPDRQGPFIWKSGNDIFQFQLGSGQVIKGWDLGVPCMLEGETRELVVASDLAYGESGRGETVPPNTTLIFTIELVKLTSPE